MTQLKKISSERAPKAIGPYSQAVSAGGFIFTSGQIPLDIDGQVVAGGIAEQTEQVMQNLMEVLSAAGASFQTVVKATIYLKDMNHFPQVNEIYAAHFGDHQPARTTVEVSRLPKDVLVEIDLIAANFVEYIKD